MKPQIEIWNVLHDGEITGYTQEGSSVSIFVNIPYLRSRIEPLGDSFILKLTGVRKIEYLSFDGSPFSFEEELNNSPEILSTVSTSYPITINTTLGQLILDYTDCIIELDTGEVIEFDRVAKVYDEYWEEWSRKAKQSRSYNLLDAQKEP